MMATFTNVFLWSSTPGLIRRPVDQLSFVVPWTPVRMFPQQVCLLRSSPPHHNPLYCRLYLCAVSFIFEDIFCFQMSLVMWSRFTPLGGLNMEHGQDVLSIWKWFVLFFLAIPGQKGALTCQPLWWQDPRRADMMSHCISFFPLVAIPHKI